MLNGNKQFIWVIHLLNIVWQKTKENSRHIGALLSLNIHPEYIHKFCAHKKRIAKKNLAKNIYLRLKIMAKSCHVTLDI